MPTTDEEWDLFEVPRVYHPFVETSVLLTREDKTIKPELYDEGALARAFLKEALDAGDEATEESTPLLRLKQFREHVWGNEVVSSGPLTSFKIMWIHAVLESTAFDD